MTLTCDRCGHPDHWHRHDDHACLSTHPQPCSPDVAPFRCLGYDVDAPGMPSGTPESRCGCPDFRKRPGAMPFDPGTLTWLFRRPRLAAALPWRGLHRRLCVCTRCAERHPERLAFAINSCRLFGRAIRQAGPDRRRFRARLNGHFIKRHESKHARDLRRVALVQAHQRYLLRARALRARLPVAELDAIAPPPAAPLDVDRSFESRELA